ncbi:MAG: right-handed parallel beta-helix repeat-containing protein, partial [Thermoplasmata archaeon]|nr:right-handed parallel beta-helix repeat-containing protein [Thermoplasmata archaeon]
MRTTVEKMDVFLSIFLSCLMIGSSLLVLAWASGSEFSQAGESPDPAAPSYPHTPSPGSAALAATIYVDDDNWADPMQDGSEEHPYDTINEALDDAENGDTIMVKDGTYDEDIEIDVSVFIIGYGDDDTIITGGGEDDVVNITSDNVEMKGFSVDIESEATTGIMVRSDNNRLADISVNNPDRNGIFLENARDNDIVNCTSHNSDGSSGLYLKSSSDNELIDCTSYDNFYAGIYFDSSSNNRIERCTCYGNYHSFNILGSSDSNEIIDCTAYSNSRDGFDIGGTSNELTNCTATGNRDGFNILGSSNKVTDCHSHGNRRCGIYLGGSSHTILDCNSSDNEMGVFSYRSSRHTIANTSFCNNSQQGIRLYQSTNNLIYNNYFDNPENYYATGASGTRWNITKEKGESIIGGPCLGGNYWSDYEGGDTDGDGIGNTEVPYGPGDYLPLAEPKGENLPPDKPIDCSPGNDETNISTNPTIEANVSDPNGGQIHVTFYNASDDSVIGKDNGVNNRTAGVEWKNLEHDTTYGWYVVVDDSEEETRSDTWRFTTKERPNELPTADFDHQPREILTGDEVRFTDNSTDPDGEIVEWRWDFEDDGGVDSSERDPVHRYAVAGEYTVN